MDHNNCHCCLHVLCFVFSYPLPWQPPGAQFSERQVVRDNFVQRGAGNMKEMTDGTSGDEFRSELCYVHSKTLSQTALHSRRKLEYDPPSLIAATILL